MSIESPGKVSQDAKEAHEHSRNNAI